MPPKSCQSFLLRKFVGQEHAVAAVVNTLESSRERDGRPLGIFLFHDPTTLYWEDFAKYLSCLLYDTDDLSLRLDLSLDRDTLLISANGKGKLSELWDGVKKRPFSLVILEKVDQAHDSVIDTVCDCLTGGCLVEGTGVDFSRTIVVMVSTNCSSHSYLPSCPSLPSIFNHSARRFMDQADEESRNKGCRCNEKLREVKAHLNLKLWNVLDDVVLLAKPALCYVFAYARFLLREIAASFCHGRLIVYASDSALWAAGNCSDRVKGDIDLKHWLELNVAPTLKELEGRGNLDDMSIVFIDNYVGTNELSYRVEKYCAFLEDDVTKSFSRFANNCRAIYQKGKFLEDNTTSLRKGLAEICTLINGGKMEAASFVATIENLVKIVDNVIEADNDIRILKERLCCSDEQADFVPRVSNDEGIRLDSLRAAVRSHSSSLEMITIVKRVFLRKFNTLKGSNISPSSYLLLGLEDDGKKELLAELERNFGVLGIPLVNVSLLEYSKEDSVSCSQAFSLRSNHCHGLLLHLVKVVKEHPYSILYFDQVERADSSTFGLLMSLLDYGISLDGEGNVVDFQSTVIIIASDVGNKHLMSKLVARSLKKRGIVGRGGRVRDSVSPNQDGNPFRSELFSRMGEVIVFDPFAPEPLKSLARMPVSTAISWKNPGGQLSVLFIMDLNLKDKKAIWRYTLSNLLRRVIC